MPRSSSRAKPASTIEGSGRIAHQHLGDALDRPLGRGQPDPLRPRAPFGGHQGLQTLQRQRQVGAALVVGDRVDLVQDHGADAGQRRTPTPAGEEDVERLGCGDEDVRRPLGQLGALGLGRVTRADADPDPSDSGIGLGQLAQRSCEVFRDVVGERLQGRDVQDVRALLERVVERATHQIVERGQEGRQRLARSRGRGDQRVVSGPDERPALPLRRRHRGEATRKPARDPGVERRQHHTL